MGYRCLLQMWTVRTFCIGISTLASGSETAIVAPVQRPFSAGRGQEQRAAPGRGFTPSSRPSVPAGRG